MNKFVISSVAALALVAGASSANGQTVAELQALIASLQSQIAALAGTTTTTTVTSSYVNPGVTLRVGSKGVAVTALQNALNNLGFNAGKADGVFGNGTAAAVRAFQASKGLGADGVAGNQTHGALTVALSGTTTVPTVPGTSTNLSGDEASLKVSVVSEDDVVKNVANQHAFTIEVEAAKRGGDAKIERVDIDFTTKDGTDILRNHKVINAITLEVDGKEVASETTNRRSDWDDDSIRFSGLNVIAKSGQTVEIKVLLDLADNSDVDSIVITSSEVRYADGAGIVSTENTGSTPLTVNVNVGSSSDFDIKFSKNKNTPEDYTVDLTSAKNNQTLVIVDADVRDGAEGILEDAKVTFASALSSTTVKSVDFYIDGKKVDTIDSAADIDTKSVLTFDLNEFEFEGGDDFDFSVKVNLKKDGTGSIQVTEIQFVGEDEGGNSLNANDFKVTTTSYAAVITMTGGDVEVETVEFDITEPVGTGTKGTVTFTLEVTNDSGAAITWTPALANFKIEGISTLDDFEVNGAAPAAISIADNATVEVDFEFTYTGVSSNKSLKITLEKIGTLPVYYIVETN